MEPAPFPNRLRAIDLSQSILVHMAQELEFQLGEVIRAVTSNTPSSALATYQLLQRRLTRYKQLQRHLSTDVQITVRTHSRLLTSVAFSQPLSLSVSVIVHYICHYAAQVTLCSLYVQCASKAL